MTKKIHCKWCEQGLSPRNDGNHWIVKSIIPARITVKECAYHKAGARAASLNAHGNQAEQAPAVEAKGA